MKNKQNKKELKKERQQYIIENYENMIDKEIAEELDITPKVVGNLRRQLGLEKPRGLKKGTKLLSDEEIKKREADANSKSARAKERKTAKESAEIEMEKSASIRRELQRKYLPKINEINREIRSMYKKPYKYWTDADWEEKNKLLKKKHLLEVDREEEFDFIFKERYDNI